MLMFKESLHWDVINSQGIIKKHMTNLSKVVTFRNIVSEA